MPGGELMAHVPLSALFAGQQPMSPGQLMMLLRNLLQMPREMVQLMALLANLEQSTTQEILQKLMTEDIPVPLEELQQFLTTHAGKCQEKLLKLMQSSHMDWGGSGKDMGDLMTLLSQVTSQAKQSPADALQSTLSLYLPYYPLQGPQRFSLHFEDMEGGGEDGGAENKQLVIFIDTITLGQFRISMATARRQTQLQILIIHDPLEPELLSEIETQVKQALSAENTLPPELLFQERAGAAVRARQQPTSPDASQKNDKPAVAIHPSEGISISSIHAAYVLIRVILDIDSRQVLHKQRASAV